MEKLSLKTRRKLNDGRSIPVLGFGTWKLSKAETPEAVSAALETGYRLVDTATLYANEEQVGRAVQKAAKQLKLERKDVFVTTKIWNSDHGNPRGALETSLEKLGMEYVDLYLIHWPVPERLATWKAFEGFRKDGRCKSIGVSNFTVGDLEELMAESEAKPAVNQVEFTPFLYQKELLEFCKRQDILVEAYSPLTRGHRLDHPVLQEVAEKNGRSVAQVLVRWCLQHGAVPLPKSANPAHIRQNAGVFDFALSAADMKRLDGLDEGHHEGWNPNDRFRKPLVDFATKHWPLH